MTSDEVWTNRLNAAGRQIVQLERALASLIWRVDERGDMNLEGTDLGSAMAAARRALRTDSNEAAHTNPGGSNDESGKVGRGSEVDPRSAQHVERSRAYLRDVRGQGQGELDGAPDRPGASRGCGEAGEILGEVLGVVAKWRAEETGDDCCYSLRRELADEIERAARAAPVDPTRDETCDCGHPKTRHWRALDGKPPCPAPATSDAAPRCPHYYDTHDRKCVLFEGHPGEHLFRKAATPPLSVEPREDPLRAELDVLAAKWRREVRLWVERGGDIEDGYAEGRAESFEACVNDLESLLACRSADPTEPKETSEP